ncbi:hypothetical protein HG536_0E00970 [Torulaspora globosa]|uniref:Restriction of telomere capping protein 5 n=1 Tax=Torulaspora globosa TaxID=48254 RepID=A0A7G3ZI50_9SACH|nr:uncharacterized protein HG536_0E00970 [Torulaspora globosa]QLL33186.1 hypothetical protein HG536_0E00970 [Torulaspora globosa]
MGQQTSVPQGDQNEADNKGKRFASSVDLMQYFNKRAIGFFSVAEIAAFKSRFDGRKLSATIKSADLAEWLHIPGDSVLLCQMIYEFVRVLSNFPLMKDAFEEVTGVGLLKAILLSDPVRCHKYVGVKNYDYLKLLFIAFSTRKSVKEELSSGSSTSLEEGEDLKKLIRNYNGIAVDELVLDAKLLLQLLTWLLLLTSHCPTGNCEFPDETAYNDWSSYKQAATCLLRAMNPEIISVSDLQSVTFEQFSSSIKAIMPNIFRPLQKLMEHLLYRDEDLVACLLDTGNLRNRSKLMTQPVLAQLFVSLPDKLSVSNLQKLYVGSESGFSMRSLQAKVFKWMAPTLLLVSGKSILDDEEFSKSNPRYRKFLSEFPKLKEGTPNPFDLRSNKTKVTFAIYVPDPWRVTNKDFFGGLGTTIVQLAPIQDVFKAVKDGTMYFNTMGGGIGIGDNQPQIKASSKSYSVGNVSLTIDNTLEFAAFRQTGYGGIFSPSSRLKEIHKENRPFEVRFLIQHVEVWGCGGEKELEEQYKKWQWEEAEAKRRQQINLRSIGEDRALLEMAGIIGHAQSGGSI